MVVATFEEFFELLTKSKLLSSDDLAEAEMAAADLTEPRHIAARLVEHEQITRWQAQQLLAGRSAMHLGKYTLLELIGSGSKGRVYLAEHKQMGRRVALKTINPPSDGSIKQLLSEIRAVFALDHHNIIHIYDVDRHATRYYLVMEYAEGQDLQQIVKQKGPLDFESVGDTMHQTAQGLAHAHDQGIIHRGLKPANLLVDSQGTIKILNMGVTGLDESGRQPADDGSTQEAINYNSPEQVFGSDKIDFRTDIFSLGCTCYFLLTGHPPFSEGTDDRLLLKQQSKGPTDILQVRSDTPVELVEICRKMMSTRPNDRYATAHQAGEALGHWLKRYREEHPREVAATPLIPSIQPSSQPPALAGDTVVATAGASTGTLDLDDDEGYSTVPTRRKSNKAPILMGAVAAAVLLIGLIVILMSGPKISQVPLSSSTQPPKHLKEVIPKNAEWRYWTLSDPDAAWFEKDFDDSAWKKGAAGFGSHGEKTNLHLKDKQFTRIYIRKRFDAKSYRNQAKAMGLMARFDDAFIAYLNGKEVIRVFVGLDRGAKASEIKGHGSPKFSYFPIHDWKKYLVPGTNVIAIEAHNNTDTYRGHQGRDHMMIDPYLVASVEPKPVKKKPTKTKALPKPKLAKKKPPRKTPVKTEPVIKEPPVKTPVKTKPVKKEPKKPSWGGSTEDLVAHWSFDDAEKPGKDDSGNAHDGTLKGDAAVVTDDTRGNVLSLDGNGDSVQLASNNPDFSTFSKITLSAWVKPSTNLKKHQSIFRKEDGDKRVKFAFKDNGTHLTLGLNINGRVELDASITPAQVVDGKWHHCAATFDGSTMRVYLDGTEVGSRKRPGSISAGGGASGYIGAFKNKECFPGLMDDVRIYNRALSKEEIGQLFTANLKGPFHELPDGVELPKLTDTKPVVLGTIDVEPKAIYFVSLLGSEVALKGRQSFALERTDPDPDKILQSRNWIFKLYPGKPTPSGGVAIARLALRKKKLLFKWTDKAKTNATACSLLRNCLLDMISGKAKHSMALRKPVLVEPLVLNFTERVTAKFKIDLLPNSKALLVEITKFEGDFPEHKFAPSRASAGAKALPNNVIAPKDQMFIGLFGKLPDEKNKDQDKRVYPLVFKITYTLKQLSLLTYYQVSSDRRASRYNEALIKKESKKASTQFEKLADTVARLSTKRELLEKGFQQAKEDLKRLKDVPDSPQKQADKQRFEQQRNHFKKQRTEADGKLDLYKKQLKAAQLETVQFELLKKYRDQLNGTGKIHFRIYHKIDGRRVYLVTTRAPNQPIKLNKE